MNRFHGCIIVLSTLLTALAIGVVDLDVVSAGAVQVKVLKKEAVYASLWLGLLGAIVLSWPATKSAYEEFQHAAASRANGIAHEKIVQLGVRAYPVHLERAGNFKYSELKRVNLWTRQGTILVGTNPDGSARLAPFDISMWRLCPELFKAYWQATTEGGGALLFMPYFIALIPAWCSLKTPWDGSPYNLLQLLGL